MYPHWVLKQCTLADTIVQMAVPFCNTSRFVGGGLNELVRHCSIMSNKGLMMNRSDDCACVGIVKYLAEHVK